MTNVQSRNLGVSIDEITHTKGGVPKMRTCAYKGEEGQKMVITCIQVLNG